MRYFDKVFFKLLLTFVLLILLSIGLLAYVNSR